MASASSCRVVASSTPLAVLVAVAVIVALATLLWSGMGDPRANPLSVPLALVDPDTLDAALVVEARLGGRSLLLQLDTGFSGAISISGKALVADSSHASHPIAQRYRAHLAALEAVDDATAAAALRDFLAGESCTAFAGGCGTIVRTVAQAEVVRHAQLWHCGCLAFGNSDGGVSCLGRRGADVLNAVSDVRSPSMLSFDALRDAAPAVLWMNPGGDGGHRDRDSSAALWEPCGPVRAAVLRATFRAKPLALRDGAPVVEAVVGGAPLTLLLDTGAGFAVMLFPDAAQRAATEGGGGEGGGTEIVGIHGKTLSARSSTAVVRLAHRSFEGVPVLLANERGGGGGNGSAAYDGIVGLGLLRCFDIYLGRRHLGLKANGRTPVAP